MLEVLGLGFNQALSGEEEDKEARIAQMFFAHLGLKLSSGCVEVFKPAGQKTCPPAQTSETESWGWALADEAGLHLSH